MRTLAIADWSCAIVASLNSFGACDASCAGEASDWAAARAQRQKGPAGDRTGAGAGPERGA